MPEKLPKRTVFRYHEKFSGGATQTARHSEEKTLHRPHIFDPIFSKCVYAYGRELHDV